MAQKIRSKEFEGAKTAALIYLELKELKNDNLAPGNYKAKIAQLLEPAELKLRLLNFSWLDFLSKYTYISLKIYCYIYISLALAVRVRA